MARHERQQARSFDMSITVSEDDARALREIAPRAKTVVVPNGVDTNYFDNATPDGEEPQSLVFTGSMSYQPNVEAMTYFTQRIYPHILQMCPSVRLYIVGRSPAPEIEALGVQHPGRVFVTGTVDDVRPFLRRAAVVVVPLRNGGGTRLKILEALAMHKPVVSTTVGAEGLAVIDKKHILIADDDQQFADSVVSLVKDSAKRQRLGEAGRRLVEARYDWRHIAPLLEAAWECTVKHHAQRKEHLT